MARVLAVNNYPTEERFGRLVAALEGSGARVTVARRDDVSAVRFDSFDGVVLSGSPDMMSSPKAVAKYAVEMKAILESSAPLLGICFGHQMIARAFGSEVVKDRENVVRMVETTVVKEDPLFSDLQSPMMLLESREEVVKSLPRGFSLLARSATSEVAAFKHLKRPLYGVQSHPERFTAGNPDGSRVISNFVRLLA